MTAIIWSLITVCLYPHLTGVACIEILHFQYGRQTDQARMSRGCSGLFEIHILGSEVLLGSDSAAWQTRQICDRRIYYFHSCPERVGIGSQPMGLQDAVPQLSTQPTYKI